VYSDMESPLIVDSMIIYTFVLTLWCHGVMQLLTAEIALSVHNVFDALHIKSTPCSSMSPCCVLYLLCIAAQLKPLRASTAVDMQSVD